MTPAVGRRPLHGQQQEGPAAARTLGRRIPEQREVAAVEVPQEVLDARGQPLEVGRGVR